MFKKLIDEKVLEDLDAEQRHDLESYIDFLLEEHGQGDVTTLIRLIKMGHLVSAEVRDWMGDLVLDYLVGTLKVPTKHQNFLRERNEAILYLWDREVNPPESSFRDLNNEESAEENKQHKEVKTGELIAKLASQFRIGHKTVESIVYEKTKPPKK